MRGQAGPVLLAPDAFKGTMSARTVAAALAGGLRGAGIAVDECPVADGGEGTIDVLLQAQGGRLVPASARDPLDRVVESAWAWLGGAAGTAVVEAARACGLALVDEGEREPELASSAGVGDLIVAALEAGAKRVILAVGGTASTDGGRGAIEAMADAGVGDLDLLVACDVQTPFERAATVFGPQKGADAAAVQRLRERLGQLASGLARDPTGVPMTGAGGGLAGGLWAAHGARLCSGAELVLDAVGFDARLDRASAVVVGEGRLDAQSLGGKVAGEILGRARRTGVPGHAVVGSLDLGVGELEAIGLASVLCAGSEAELRALGARWPWVEAR